MGTIDHCRLLCASASAYLIETTLDTGIHRIDLRPPPTTGADNNHNIINQYDAIKLINDPYVIVASPFKHPNKFLKIEACFIGETEEGIIISYRGTLPLKPIDPQMIADWIENIFYAKPVPYLPNAKAEVHEGFLDAVCKLEDGINFALDQLDPKKTKPIYLTGHSKGGAMAPIAAMRFKENNQFTADHVVTFAGPKPGDAPFSTIYNAAFPKSTNYENYLDIVPFMPPGRIAIEALTTVIPKSWTYLHKLLEDAEKWDYHPVSNVIYIKDDATTLADPDKFLDLERLYDIGKTLVSDTSLIGDAHHVTCGFRYMKAVCSGTVCTP